MKENVFKKIYPIVIERDSKGNVINREIWDERDVCYVPRAGEVISFDDLDYDLYVKGDYERNESGKIKVNDVEFYRVLAVIHEEVEGDKGVGGYCTNIIIEQIKGNKVKFLSDCMYDKGLYFVEPKNFED